MKVSDVMIRNVVTIDANATLTEAAEHMVEENVGALPVTDTSGAVTGMITDRDMVVRALANGLDPASTQVALCATAAPVCAHPEWELTRAMGLMAQHQIGRLPVVDEREHIVGMVTLSSLALRSGNSGRETMQTAQEVSRRSARA